LRFNPATREREQGYMASNKQTIKLYWMATDDHDEDWFIFQLSPPFILPWDASRALDTAC